jgi:hypothetical protein
LFETYFTFKVSVVTAVVGFSAVGLPDPATLFVDFGLLLPSSDIVNTYLTAQQMIGDVKAYNNLTV